MLVSYDGIAFECEQILQYDQTPVYSDDGGNDYLYTHIRLRVRAVWNPTATRSFEDNGDPMVAAASIEDLRHRLSQPRKVLKVRVPSGGAAASNVLVTSPMLDPNGSRYPCDAKNGPCPIGMPIISIIGERTAIVEFAVETWQTLCPKGRPLISHRWQETHDISSDYYTTRTVQGLAIFRSDVMQKNDLVPDDFRSAIFHPVPFGFKRQSVHVEASSDGTALRYTFVDQEMPLIMASGDKGITRIEGTYTYHKGVGKVSLANARAGAEVGARAGGGLGAAAAGAIGALIDGAGLYPPVTYRLNCRVWGEKATKRSDLLRCLARVLAAFHLDGDNDAGLAGIAAGTMSFMFVDKVITLDIIGKYAEITATLRVPSEINAAVHGGIGLAFFLPPNPDENPDGFTEDLGTIASATISDGHAPKTDSGTRGGYIAHMAAQQLMTPCVAPNSPDPDQYEQTNAATDTAED